MQIEVVLTMDTAEISKEDIRKELKKFSGTLERKYDAEIYSVEIIDKYE